MKKDRKKLERKFRNYSPIVQISKVYKLLIKRRSKKILHKQWENLFVSYMEKKLVFCPLTYSSFPYFSYNLKLSLISNYIGLAKIMDCLSTTKKTSFFLQTCAKTQVKEIEIEKKLTSRMKVDSLFLRWIKHLLLYKFTHSIQYSIFFCSQRVFPFLQNKLSINQSSDFLFLKTNDLLILKFIKTQIDQWSNNISEWNQPITSNWETNRLNFHLKKEKHLKIK